MHTVARVPEHPDYGIDAPGVVRNLFVVGAIGWLVWGTVALGLWSGQLVIPFPGLRLVFPLAGMGLGCGIGFTLMGVWMLWDSKVVFLDELTQGLDPQARRATWELVREIRQGGTTVVLVTHFMDEAEHLCDRVAVVDNGKVVALGTPQLAGNLAAQGTMSRNAL